MSFKSQGLIHDLATYIHKRTKTNLSFAETGASILVSTAIGPKVVISDEIGDVYFNLFGIVIGGTAISNKTVALDIVRSAIVELGTKLKKDLAQPEKFSIEGWSKYLLDHPEGASIGDEYTGMFKSKGKQWFTDSMEFLSKVYDCKIPKYETIARGTEYVPSIYINFLSATTFYLLKLIKDDDFFIQGTGCRILWDVDTERAEINSAIGKDGAEFFLNGAGRERRDQELSDLVDRLFNLHNWVEKLGKGEKYTLWLSLEALGRLSKYRVDRINKATRLFNIDVLDPDVGYIARLPENAIKLAGLHCISRCFEDASPIDDPPEVNAEDVEWATTKTDHHFEMYLKMKEIRDRIQADYRTRGHKTDFQRVLNIIEREGGYSNISKIMTGTHWLKKDALNVLQAMVMGQIIESKRVKGERGMEHAVYVSYGDVIPWVTKHAVVKEEWVMDAQIEKVKEE